MRAFLASLAVAPALSGCFGVFYIPSSTIDTVAGRPTFCVADNAKVGDRLRHPKSGEVYEITKLAGPSAYFCRDQPEGRKMGAEMKPIAT